MGTTSRLLSSSSILAWVGLLAGCQGVGSPEQPNGAPPGAPINPAAAPTATLEEYADAICRRFEQCESDIGRVFDNRQSCVAQFERFAAEVRIEVPTRACVTALPELDCWQLLGGPTDGPCENSLRRLPTAGVGEPCDFDDCGDQAACLDDPSSGYHCSRCRSRVGVGEPCGATVAQCDADGLCREDPCSDTDCFERCVDAEDATCDDHWDCGNGAYFCDDDGTCSVRRPGAPCAAFFGSFRITPIETVGYCPVEGLVCVDDACAAPAALGQACDDQRDCADPTHVCLGGQCAASGTRGQPCADHMECRGYLICDGTCQDAPGQGEACAELCTLPSMCGGGVCIDITTFQGPFGPAELALGEVCGASCGPTCNYGQRACEDGYCDIYGNAPTLRCVSYKSLGDPCTIGECDPTTASCELGPNGRVCTAPALIGQDCSNRPCVPTAWCNEDGSTCAPLAPNGAPCTVAESCQSENCYGTCAGDYEGLPCLGMSDCGSGQCVGTCDDERSDWQACGD